MATALGARTRATINAQNVNVVNGWTMIDRDVYLYKGGSFWLATAVVPFLGTCDVWPGSSSPSFPIVLGGVSGMLLDRGHRDWLLQEQEEVVRG